MRSSPGKFWGSLFLCLSCLPTHPPIHLRGKTGGGWAGKKVGTVHTVRKVEYGAGKDVWRRKEVLSRVLYGGRSGSTHVPRREGCNPGLPVWAFVRCTPAMACSSLQPGAEMPPCLCTSLPGRNLSALHTLESPPSLTLPGGVSGVPPKDRGVGSPLGPLGPPGRAKSSAGKVHRYIGSCGHCALGWAGLGLRFAALRTALYPSITCCDFGRPARPDAGKKGAIHGSFLKRSRLPSSHPPRPPLPLFPP